MKPPTKPADTRYRVLRGGGCSLEPSWVRAAIRSTNEPANRFSIIGFRCALRGREPRT